MSTVADNVPRSDWLESLDHEIWACPADSVVGKAVIDYIRAAEELMAQTTEADLTDRIQTAVIDQINVWYFG